MKFEKRGVDINGKKTFFWEKNQHGKQAIIFLHGLPGSHAGLTDLANAFSDSYRLIIPDLPGWGKSEWLDGRYTLKDYAHWLSAFLEKLSLNSVILVGHSFGARLAIFFSIGEKEKVTDLVLLTPVIKNDGLLDRVASLKYETAKFLPLGLKRYYLSSRIYEKIAAFVVFKSASVRKRRAIISRNVRELRRIDPKTQFIAFNEFYKLDLTDSGKKLNSKCLIIAGEEDMVATLRSVKLLSENIKNSSLYVMKGAGHLLPIERPVTTANIIKHWLWG